MSAATIITVYDIRVPDHRRILVDRINAGGRWMRVKCLPVLDDNQFGLSEGSIYFSAQLLAELDEMFPGHGSHEMN